MYVDIVISNVSNLNKHFFYPVSCLVEIKLFRIVAHTYGLGWYITSNQQGQMFVQNLNRLSAGQMLRQSRSRIAPQTVIQLCWCFSKTFLRTHKFRTAWAIEMTADREEWLPIITATIATRTRSVIRRSSVPPSAWVGPTTNWSQPETVKLHWYLIQKSDSNSNWSIEAFFKIKKWKQTHVKQNAFRAIVQIRTCKLKGSQCRE